MNYDKILNLASEFLKITKNAEAEPEQITSIDRTHFAVVMTAAGTAYNKELMGKVNSLMQAQSYPQANVACKISKYAINASKGPDNSWALISGPNGFIYDDDTLFRDPVWATQFKEIKSRHENALKSKIVTELNRMKSTINFGKVIKNHIENINADGSYIVNVEINF